MKMKIKAKKLKSALHKQQDTLKILVNTGSTIEIHEFKFKNKFDETITT